jgi:A1 cistron-splicing factor AAR2
VSHFRFLAIYEFENYGRWKNLTSLLTESAIARLTPESGMIRNEVEFRSCPDKDRPRGKPEAQIRNIRIRSNDDEALYLPNLEVISDSQPKFSKLPERYNKFSSPSEKTFNNIDTVNLIDKLVDEISSKSEILEELQFCFVIYLCGLSIDSLAHWRQIVSLFCNSEQGVSKHKNFYKDFINIIKYQVPEIPIEFIEQSSSNTIYIDIKNLLRNLIVNECTQNANLLQKHLKDTIGWTFDDLLQEDPEDMPQIVDIENS